MPSSDHLNPIRVSPCFLACCGVKGKEGRLLSEAGESRVCSLSLSYVRFWSRAFWALLLLRAEIAASFCP